MTNKEIILNEIINYEELVKEQKGCVKVFNYTQLNKTVYYYYNHSKTNKTKYNLDDMVAEAYYLILTTIDKMNIDFNTEKTKYINYLNRCLTNHYHTLYNQELKDVKTSYIEDLCFKDDNNNSSIDKLKIDNQSEHTYFPVDDTYSNYIMFIIENKHNIFNEKEVMILEDIMYNKNKYSEKVKKMLVELNTTVNIDNHKNSLMNKINRRFNIWCLINEVLEGNYENALKFIYRDKYNDNIKFNKEYANTLIQLLEYNIYKKEYFINKYNYYYVYNIGVHMYQMKVKLHKKMLAGDKYGN